MKSEYDIQAEQFLKSCNTTFTSTYLGCEIDKYFSSREHCIFRCVFRRKLDNGKTKCLQVKFHQSIAQGSTKPTAYEVLVCLQKFDVGSFYEFCEEFGYNKFDDYGYCYNKISKHIYNALVREYRSVMRVFGDVIESLSEIV